MTPTSDLDPEIKYWYCLHCGYRITDIQYKRLQANLPCLKCKNPVHDYYPEIKETETP